MQIPLTRSLPALSLRGETTQPSWWVENFRERSLNKQRLPVRMCHVHSQVLGSPFDPFTGNLFLHGWLCLGGRLYRARGLEIWNWIFPNKSSTPTICVLLPLHKNISPLLTVTSAKVVASLLIRIVSMLRLKRFSRCNGSRHGGVQSLITLMMIICLIKWLGGRGRSGMAAWPLSSRLSRISALSGSLLASRHCLCRAFQIHHKELNSGYRENEESSDALSSFKPHSLITCWLTWVIVSNIQ